MGWKHKEAVFLGTFWGEVLGACLTNSLSGGLVNCIVVWSCVFCFASVAKFSEAVQHLPIKCAMMF